MSREINFRFDEKWRENATKLLGVPLHPLGELNPYDAVVKKTDGQEPVEKVVRQRMFMFQVQLFFNMLLLFAFLYISYISAKLIVKRKSNIAAWCNFISSILGASVGIVYMLMMLSSYGNCRIFAWYILTTGIIGTMCNTTAVLQRAYLALGGKGWVAMVGILLILPESSFAFYTIATSYTGTDDAGGCVCIYDNFTAPLWFMVIMPINILFSTIFCYVTYTQYCKFGLDAWRRLARDGIQSMCLIVICNILCGGLLLEKIGGDQAEFFFNIDWLITSTILSIHSIRIGKTASSMATSKNFKTTCNSFNDFKNIATSYHGPNATETLFQSYIQRGR